jgi:hypothetical protein
MAGKNGWECHGENNDVGRKWLSRLSLTTFEHGVKRYVIRENVDGGAEWVGYASFDCASERRTLRARDGEAVMDNLETLENRKMTYRH